MSLVDERMKTRIPSAVLEAIGIQEERAREAGARVTREGSVVRDLKGAIIAHPGIAIEASAHKTINDLLKAWLK